MNINEQADAVLADPDSDQRSRALAAYILRVDQPAKPTAELERILGKIEGREGQSERAEEIRQELARRKAEAE